MQKETPLNQIKRDLEKTAELYHTTFDNILHRLVLSAHERGYSQEEIAAFLEIPVDSVENFLTYSPDTFEPS